MQLRVILGIDGICDLDLHKKGQNGLTYSLVYRFQYADNLAQNVHICENGRLETAAAVFAFGPTSPTSATVYLNHGLWPPSAYIVVVHMPTTAAFLGTITLKYVN